MKPDHFSASQINLFLAEPAMWWLQYVKGIRGEAGPAAWRGQAVEAGLVRMLAGESATSAAHAAQAAFEELTQGELSDATEKQRAMLFEMMTQAHQTLGQDRPLTTQRKIVLNDPDIACPIIGYIDFHFPDRNVDLKTTERCPSEPRVEHARQLAIYRKATNEPQWLLYVTPKKAAMYEVTEAMADELWPSIKAACRAMARALEIGDHTLFPPRDTGSFYWDDKTRAAAREVWF